MAPKQTYDASTIQVLADLEAIRKRPGMYIGGADVEGLHHLVWEVMDNAKDEALGGHATEMTVTLNDDGSVEVTDNGRGIPVDSTDGQVTALELVFTKTHAGGKFGDDAYAAAGGQHGVGVKAVNALSTRMVVEVDRDGATHRLCFDGGAAGQFGGTGNRLAYAQFTAGHTVAKVGAVPKGRTGTRVRFWPDIDLFEDGSILDYQRIAERCEGAASIIAGLKVTVADRRRASPTAGEKATYRYTDGLLDYARRLATDLGSPLSDPVWIEGAGTFETKDAGRQVTRTCEVEIGLRWTDGTDGSLQSFVNGIPTPDHGPHVEGFVRALNRAVNDVLLKDNASRKMSAVAKEPVDDRYKRATEEDTLAGLAVVLQVRIQEPQFTSQTKSRLGNTGVAAPVYEAAKDALSAWFATGGKRAQVKAIADAVADRVLHRVRHRAELTVSKKVKASSAGMPDKLADCADHGPGTELLIVEGNSAAAPVKAGRDASYQACFPIRGKIINTASVSRTKAMANQEVQDIITCLGAGVGRNVDLEAARYERVILLMDADADGAHIRALLLTMFAHLLRPFLEAGRVYAACPPLYSTKSGGKTYYAFSDAERDRIEAQITKGRRNPTPLYWARFKGLGEMDVDELASTALDPETRTLRQITVPDADAADKMLEVLMGRDAEARRTQITARSADYGHAIDV